MANRIAQTKLARVHQHALGAALMADPTISVLQVVLSGSHPRTDICDLHARADLFGLGPGCYPKAKAPRPTFHPYCRCRLRSRPDLNAADARARRRGDAGYLRSLPVDEAAVKGSRTKLQRVLDGRSAIEVVNRGVPDAYQTVRLGEVAQSRAVRDDDFKLPEPGDPHHGLLVDIREKFGPYQLRAGIASFDKRVAEHEGWIADPSIKPGVAEHPTEDIARWVKTKWPQDVARLKAQRAIYVAVLKEKEDGFKPGGS